MELHIENLKRLSEVFEQTPKLDTFFVTKATKNYPCYSSSTTSILDTSLRLDTTVSQSVCLFSEELKTFLMLFTHCLYILNKYFDSSYLTLKSLSRLQEMWLAKLLTRQSNVSHFLERFIAVSAHSQSEKNGHLYPYTSFLFC